MIEIKKVTNINCAQSICLKYNIAWNPNFHVIATMEGETVLQCAVFSYEKDKGEIHVITGFEDDLGLLDGLCRAILNIMDINGVKEVCLSGEHEKLAQKVGFKPRNGSFYLDLDGFFGCGCCHKQMEENK